MQSFLLLNISAARRCIGFGSRALSIAAARNEATLQELYMRAVEPKVPEAPALSPADAQRYEASAKLYTKLMWRRERVFKRDLSRKLALKWAALHALPTEDLRREALVIDPFVPAHIRHALQTPPLAGFHGAEDAEREAARVAQEAAAALARAASAAERAASESAASGATGRRALAEVKRAAPARGGRSRGGTRSDDIDFGALLAPAAEAPANGGNKK